MIDKLALSPSLPDLARVLSFGTTHNPLVWQKHQKLVSNCRALQMALQVARAQKRFERHQVFALACGDTSAGAIAAMIWGFPRGGPRGQHQGFVKAFRRIDEYATVIDDARSNRRSAAETLFALNRIETGVGFAPTTKMMYFADLLSHEGKALIFDRNVIEAIRAHSSRWSQMFPQTRAALGTSPHWYGRASKAYGAFVQEATELAVGLSNATHAICPSQIDTALFLEKARRGIWS